jgi:hypothetical protein
VLGIKDLGIGIDASLSVNLNYALYSKVIEYLLPYIIVCEFVIIIHAWY